LPSFENLFKKKFLWEKFFFSTFSTIESK